MRIILQSDYLADDNDSESIITNSVELVGLLFAQDVHSLRDKISGITLEKEIYPAV